MKRTCMAGNFECQHDNFAFCAASEEYFGTGSADVMKASALYAARESIPVHVCLICNALLGEASARR